MFSKLGGNQLERKTSPPPPPKKKAVAALCVYIYRSTFNDLLLSWQPMTTVDVETFPDWDGATVAASQAVVVAEVKEKGSGGEKVRKKKKKNSPWADRE